MIEIHKRKGQTNGEEFNKEVSLDLALSRIKDLSFFVEFLCGDQIPMTPLSLRWTLKFSSFIFYLCSQIE